LLVDSASWTPRMQAEIDRAGNTTELAFLLRCYGFGVPDIERALWSAGNALTLIVEEELQPFDGDASKDMHLHSLPWPKEALRSLGAVPVELRMTLSYFIEPNPARRGWRKRHRYASHGLRFAVQKPTESVRAFRRRVNAAAREDRQQEGGEGDAEGWLLKPQLRGKGSLHHDRWQGIAADLASRDHIAVFPVIGWWRERVSLGRSQSKARYSLVVSIRTPPSEVDIYAPIETMIRNRISIPTRT
jgi:hypothetical protein